MRDATVVVLALVVVVVAVLAVVVVVVFATPFEMQIPHRGKFETLLLQVEQVRAQANFAHRLQVTIAP